MTTLRKERARIRRALRDRAARQVEFCHVPMPPLTPNLWAILDEERQRLIRTLRTGRAIGALTSRPRAARKGSE